MRGEPFETHPAVGVLTEEAEPEAARALAPASLIDLAVEATVSGRRSAATVLDAFLREPSPLEAVRRWIGRWVPRPDLPVKEQLAQLLGRDIARLDALLAGQVNAILHQPRFQRLEASWRGLQYLVSQVEEGQNIKIRVLSVTWNELARDIERAMEFDQSQLFRKVYGEEFDTPGGEPFGVLIGDYQVRHTPSAEHPVEDLAVLKGISLVAAAAFAPFIAGADPAIFGLTSFTELEQPLNLPRTFEQLEYVKWKSFRETEDARFVGLTMPRVLMRLPYDDDGTRVDGFRFREDVSGPDRRKYLWGSAAFGFAGVLMRAFAECGWLADIRGVRRGVTGGGVVAGLPVHCFSTDKRGVAPKCTTDVIVTAYQEKELSDLGFVPLCHCQDTELAVFFGNPSVQRPKLYDEPAATANAKLSAMLQYMLCVSRFAHYLKVMVRDKVGSFAEASECEDSLYRWIQSYVTSDDDASADVKARYPLREARVQVRERPGRPGNYLCVAHLRPHFQLDELTATVRLVTELAPGRPG